MSKFWNPAWQQESVLYDGRPTAEQLKALADNPPPDSGLGLIVCPFSSLLIKASIGPDWVLQVRADRRNEAAWMQQHIGRFTWYLMCDRPRIKAVLDGCFVANGVLTLEFAAALPNGQTSALRCQMETEEVSSVAVIEDGETIVLTHPSGGDLNVDAALYAQRLWKQRPAGWPADVFDLRVRYVGQAQGRVGDTCALDRLENHATYQKLLEEAARGSSTRDIWLILASGYTINFHVLTGAHEDLGSLPTPEPLVANARKLMTTRARINLVEALLINYFGPDLNTTFVGDLNRNASLFKAPKDGRIADLSVYLSTDDLGVSLYSNRAPGREHHGATLCMDGDPFKLCPV